MKYIAVTTYLAIIISLFTPISYAAEDRQPKTVSGKVRNADLTVAKNVEVSITCKSTTLTDLTSVNGNYSVTFDNLACEQFDTVDVSVTTETGSGSASKAVTFALNVSMPEIILESAPELTPTDNPLPTAVPEFGAITGIMAGSLSLIAYGRLKSWKSRF